jgi:hypothetical protein
LEECREQALSCTIDVCGDDRLGVIEVEDGRITGAAFGSLAGEEAIDCMRALRAPAYELRPRGLAAARERLAETAVALGWTPPGWRGGDEDGHAPVATRVLERLGDLALALAAGRRERE